MITECVALNQTSISLTPRLSQETSKKDGDKRENVRTGEMGRVFRKIAGQISLWLCPLSVSDKIQLELSLASVPWKIRKRACLPMHTLGQSR